MNDQPLDLLCLGEPMVELSEMADGRYLRGYGGDTSNCAVAAARHGARVGYVTRVGDDAFGEAFVSLWQSEGVDIRAVQRDRNAHTGVYFITHGPDGHQFSYLRKGSAASCLREEDIVAADLPRARWLHLSGISQAISESACDAGFRAIDIAREAGMQVAYDTNLRLKLWPLDRARAVMHAAAARADLVLPSIDDSQILTGLSSDDAVADFYLGLGARIVAVTLGERGALVATSEHRERVTPHAVSVVDASGAGDAFDGAFIARLAAGDDPFAAGRYATIAASLSTCGYGAVDPLPTRSDVLAVLRDRQ